MKTTLGESLTGLPRLTSGSAGERPLRVAVIGGGVARAGHHVRLFEAGDEFGGQVRTFEVGGGRLEAFYHHLFRSDRTIIELLDELGMGDDLRWIDSSVGFLVGGRAFPFVGPLDLLRFTPVSLPTRVRLGLAALWLRRRSNWRQYEGKRASEWIRRYVGREGYDRVWGPLLRAKFGKHAEDVSLVWFWGKIYLRFASRGQGGLLAKEQLGYLDGSFGRLVDALVDAVRGHGGQAEHSRAVRRVIVEPTESGPVARGLEVDSPRGPELVPADLIIATTPSPVFARLVPELDPAYREQLGRVQYQWATVLVLALDRPLTSIYWLTVADDDSPFVLAVEQANFVGSDRYGGLYPVYFSNYVEPGDPIIDLDAEQVLDRYLPYIQRVNPAFDRNWIIRSWLFRDRAGQPIVDTGYHTAIPAHDTGIGGLYLANTTQIYPEDRGQNYSIRMGQQVAALAVSRAQAASETGML